MSMHKYSLTTHCPFGTIYLIDQLGQQALLDTVIIQLQQGHHLLKTLVKKLLPIGNNNIYPLAFANRFNDFDNARHIPKQQTKPLIQQLTRLAKQYQFQLILTHDINNDPLIKNALSQIHSTAMLTLGGRILKQATLEQFHGQWFNGHGGILPSYRGLHSEYWAIRNNDLRNIGSTIHKLTHEIDQGALGYIQKLTNVQPHHRLYEVIAHNHANLIDSYLHFIRAYSQGGIAFTEFQVAFSQYYSSPPNVRSLLKMRVADIIQV